MKKGKAVNNTVACGDNKWNSASRQKIVKIGFPDWLKHKRLIVIGNIQYINETYKTIL